MNLYSSIPNKKEDSAFKFKFSIEEHLQLSEDRIPRIAKIAMPPKVLLLMLTLILSFSPVFSQIKTDTLVISSLGQAQQMAFDNNLIIKSGDLKVKKHEVLQKTAFDLPYTSLYFEKEEFGHRDAGIQSIGVSQSMDFQQYIKKENFSSTNKQYCRKLKII